MQVTMDVFSGRPNPSWTLPEKEARQLTERLAHRALPTADTVDGVLGFRGFIVQAGSDDAPARLGIPGSFRIAVAPASRAPEGQALSGITLDEVAEASLWLLSTAGKHVEDEVLKHAEEVLKARGKGIEESPEPAEAGPSEETEEEAPRELSKALCVIANTPYNPAFWNQPAVQPHNNCYNYAMNWRSDTFAQPGKISGHPNNVMQCANVAAAANWDGCTAFCSGSNKNVALVVWPGVDYHWYRKHSNGFWGHKPGSTAARNTDNSGKVIGGALNPFNCNRGNYTHFCGYRFSPTGMQVK